MDFGRINLAFLLFIRVSGLFMVSPIFGRINIPNIAKISFCLAISYLFFVSGVPSDAVVVYSNVVVYIMMCLKELIIGVIFGYVSYLFINLTFTAGQLIDMQMGFGMVSVLDVQSNISVPVTGNLLNITILLTFFAVDGHHKLIRLLYLTLEAIPLGQVTITQNLAIVAVELFSLSFVLAASVAFPIIAAGLLTEIALGVVIRSVPQVNIYSIGFPIKIIVGFIMIIVTIRIFVNFSSNIFNEMFIGLERMFSALVR